MKHSLTYSKSYIHIIKRAMYTREDMEKAFNAGVWRGRYIEGAYFQEEPEIFEHFIETLDEVKLEKEIPFTYASLRRKLDWDEFCCLTGTNVYALREGFGIADSEIFYIKEDKAKEYGLI